MTIRALIGLLVGATGRWHRGYRLETGAEVLVRCPDGEVRRMSGCTYGVEWDGDKVADGVFILTLDEAPVNLLPKGVTL